MFDVLRIAFCGVGVVYLAIRLTTFIHAVTCGPRTRLSEAETLEATDRFDSLLVPRSHAAVSSDSGRTIASS
jgi:hypothetical protein